MSNRTPLCAPPPLSHPLVRAGPLALAIVGVIGAASFFAFRNQLRPAAASAAVVEIPSPLARFLPADLLATGSSVPTQSLAPVVAVPIPAERPRWMALAGVASDPFATSLAPEPPLTPVFQLQSIIFGKRSSTCLINGTPCRVGDSVGLARVESIERDRVTIRVNGEVVELRLPGSKR